MNRTLPRRAGRPPVLDALAIVTALDKGESAVALARRLGVWPSSIFRARSRARRIVLREMQSTQNLSARD
jgi:hypothetical protein